MNTESTLSTDLRAQYLKRAFLAVCIMGSFILAGFSIFHYTMGRMTAMWINIAIFLLAVWAMLAVQFNLQAVGAYRLICVGTSIGLYGLMFLGPHAPFFQLVMPLVMFFFLGSREGVLWSTGFLLGVTTLLFAPELIGGHVYPTEQAARFLSCYLFVMFFGWNQATSHERLHAILAAKNEQLQREKEQLSDALKRVEEAESQLERTNLELREKSRLMETVFDNMDEGVAVSDAEGGMLFFNPSAERIIGLGAMESVPDEWSDVYGAFYPDEETRVPTDQLPLVRALWGETTDGLELFVRNDKNREGSHVSAKGRFISSDDGDGNKIKAGVVVFSDITEHKKQETRLQETIEKLRKTGPTHGDGIQERQRRRGGDRQGRGIPVRQSPRATDGRHGANGSPGRSMA